MHPYRLVKVFVAHFVSSTWPAECVVIRRDPTVHPYRLVKVFVALLVLHDLPSVLWSADPTVHPYRLMKVFADFATHYISSRWPCLLCRWTLKTQRFVYILLAHLSQSLRMSCCDHYPSVCLSISSHLWTISPLKPLGQISSNFMWSLVLKGDWKRTNDHRL